MLHLFTGINKFDFKDRRFALAEKLATQGSMTTLVEHSFAQPTQYSFLPMNML